MRPQTPALRDSRSARNVGDRVPAGVTRRSLRAADPASLRRPAPLRTIVEVSRPVFFGAITLAVVSAVSSAYLAFGRRPPAESAAAVCACDDAALKKELADLRRAVQGRGPAASGSDAEVKRLTTRVAVLETRSGVAPPPAPDKETDDAPPDGGPAKPAASLMPDGQPAYKSFDVPSAALQVRQESTGALAVTNTDPSLTGKRVVVIARAEDDSEHPVSIIVPAPEK